MLGKRYEMDGRPELLLKEIQEEARREFFEDMQRSDSPYQFEAYPCECGATEENFEVLAEKDRYGLPVRTVICNKCGLIMTNPRMTQESYDYFYVHVFGKLYRGDDGVSDIAERFKIRKQRSGKVIGNFVEKYCNIPIQSILEIGCATGANIAYFHDKGYDVTGIDLDDEYLAYGRSQGLDLRCGHSSELLKEGKKYDLIILSHVFEHFLDIEKELAVIQELLSEHGMVYIEVPGVKMVERGTYMSNFLRYIQNAHVRGFSFDTLCNVMKKYGFDLHVGDERVAALFGYTGNRTPLIGNYYADTMQSIIRAELQFLSKVAEAK